MKARVRDLELELTVDDCRCPGSPPRDEGFANAASRVMLKDDMPLPQISPGDDGVIQMRTLHDDADDSEVDEEVMATRMRCLASGVRALRGERDLGRRRAAKLESEVAEMKAILDATEELLGLAGREMDGLEEKMDMSAGRGRRRSGTSLPSVDEDNSPLSPSSNLSSSILTAFSTPLLAPPDSRKRYDSSTSRLSLTSSSATDGIGRRDLPTAIAQLRSRIEAAELALSDHDDLEAKVAVLTQALEGAETSLDNERTLLSAEMERTALLVRDLQTLKKTLDDVRAAGRVRSIEGAYLERRSSMGSFKGGVTAAALAAAAAQEAEFANAQVKMEQEIERLRGEHQVALSALERRIKVQAAEAVALAVAAERERVREENAGNLDGLMALHESQMGG
ncbi:hypothetical protein BC829DRAFT_297615 [Chytridium lagenaria]|nr:hypothetical protein BC829DRAFT_297615 [Chytridium lagenaria]